MECGNVLSVFVFTLLASSFIGCEAAEKKNVTLEVSIVTDYKLFLNWNAFYNGNYSEAIKGVYYMYSNTYKRTRDRFWDVEMEGVRFDLRFTNTEVSYSKKASSFIEEDASVKKDESTINEENAAKALGKFVKDSKFNSSDINILVTGYKLESGKESYLDGCLLSNDSVNMVITEFGQHRTIDTLTRLIAEALGVKSDESDPEIDEKEFIMSSKRRSQSFQHVENVEKFSKLSTDAFQQTLKSYVLQWDATEATINKFDVDWCARTHPFGQTYPVDKQCKFMYGQDSEVCQDAESGKSDICLRLGCTDPSKQNQCTFAGDQRAFDRTSCGEGKWCLKGKCVDDAKAPPHETYDYYVKYTW